MEKSKAIVQIGEGDSLFTIDTDSFKQDCELYTYGEPGKGALELSVSYLGATVKDIECPYSNDIVEMDMHFQEPEELGLEEERHMIYYPPEEVTDNSNCGPFQIAFNKNEMDIILGDIRKTAKFSRNDRVEYYTDDEDTLIYIRVRNLTEDEYNVLKSQKKNNNIIDNIDKEIELKEDVSVIQSSLIGSIGWGYEDNQSDIDYRFVYTRKPEDYISINKKNDTITYPIEDKKDIAGYDIGKFLNLLCEQNPSAYEIINSPKQESNEISNTIKEFSNRIFDPSKMIKVYQHLVSARIKELQNNPKNSLKLYIYILRMLGTINYIQDNNSYPTCSIEDVFASKSNEDLKLIIDKAIELKRSGEKDIAINNDVINHLEDSLNNTYQKETKSNTIDRKEVIEEANRIFFETVKKVRNAKRKEELSKIDFNENKGEEVSSINRR